VTGAADNGGEDRAGSIITGEAGLAHTRTVINDKALKILRHRELELGEMKVK
jgi:hypothetical protein